jgi:adenosylcobyric acid synthase
MGPQVNGRLMIVGTASHAGKSLLVTALCRILKQRGVRVAPFKSQNMALNSYVCRDGSEIGRAQVAQAEAAGIPPEVDMNPILLKPTSNRRIQVVLQGRVYGTMTAAEYYEQKPFFFEKALESFQRITSKFDVIILEGAGSAAEVNLKDRDIVNLPFASAVGCPALLVADIDRGGVFAAIVGTFALLNDQERKLLRGFIINRFRGDLSLFAGGTEFLERQTGRPCMGVLPYVESLHIDQEDSVSLEDHRAQSGSFNISVIRLPHISNYTDFNALERVSGVALEYVSERQTKRAPDLVIIPGTKNTIADLRWLIASGFPTLLSQTLESGGWVVGVCGGYQMLGRSVSDPFGAEEGGTQRGLDFLPVETELDVHKVTIQSEGRSFLGANVSGYEIHMGRTEYVKPLQAFITKADGSKDGAVLGRIAGTYFHGLFDNHQFTATFLTQVAESRGLSWRPGSLRYSKDDEYDRLAAVASEHLDMAKIADLIAAGGGL